MAATSLPLAGHRLFHTRDLDEAREQVARVFCPHKLSTVGSARDLDARQHAARMGTVTLSYLDYSCEVRIEPGYLEDFYLVQIPLAGAADTTAGAQNVVSTPDLAVLLTPHEPIHMHWQAGSPHLIVRLERSIVESRLAELVGRPLRRKPRFNLGLKLTDAAAQSWLSVVNLLRTDVEGGGTLTGHPETAEHLERMLVTGLLLASTHEYSEAIRNPAGPDRLPVHVRRAVELIERHAAEPLTVHDIAEAVGVSVRVLQQGFQRHLGTSPMARLRDVRLELAHRELSDPATTTSVTEVALRWGFPHIGRFGQAYRAKFGEPPSATLRRAGHSLSMSHL